MITAQEALLAITNRFGRHPSYRALHAKGVVCAGTFTATPAAAALGRAAHLTGQPVQAIVRLSNGGGDPGVADFIPDVRGLAVSFQLPDDTRTVISAQTVPYLPVRTPDAFIEMLRALAPGPAQAWRLPLFLARHPKAAATLAANARALRLPRSYVTVPYFGIHAFKWVAADGSSRYVRYSWQPGTGDQRISRRAGKQGGPDYLGAELATRLAAGPASFTLHVQIAEDGDNPDDSSASWPSSRRVINVGTLNITAIIAEQGVLVFDPTTITDGIELSDDPILRFRAPAYSVSVQNRLA